MKRNKAVILAVILSIGLSGCNSRNEKAIAREESVAREGNYTQISMDEAVKMMEEETDYIILDVRTPEEFAQKHIPKAINIPNETIGDAAISELPRKEQKIFVYCRSGNRSKQASEKPHCEAYHCRSCKKIMIDYADR